MNFISEENSIINLDSEKENETNISNNYSSKKIIQTDSNPDEINYYYLEINKKNKQILELKSIIFKLKKTQEKLIQDIKSLQKKLHPFLNKNKKDKSQEHYLITKIQKLQNENNNLKTRINKSEVKENKFINNINNRLKKAKRDIKILSFENKNNNNILLAIQNFLFNINYKLNSDNQKLIFDLSLIDNTTFIHNLQILESNLISKVNHIDNIGNIYSYNNKNYNQKSMGNLNIDYKNNSNTINNNNDKIIQNVKKIFKHKKGGMKSFLNNKNKKYKNQMNLGIYNCFYEMENQKNNQPMKAYYLANNYTKELESNEDISYENKSNNDNSSLLSYSKKEE